MSRPPTSPEPSLREAALAVLRANDRRDFTQPAAGLYPHQWSWDSAITAVGWAYLEPVRAMRELDTVLAAQWADGRLPHLVFHPEQPGAEAYRPGPEFWNSARAAAAPDSVPTSGLAAPPVHATAVRRVWRLASRTGGEAGRVASAWLRRMFPRLLAWHRYLAKMRDPEDSGLITIYHPWESWDNCPQWDPVLAGLEVGQLAEHARRDVGHVVDAAQRPSESHYRAFRWLVELLKAVDYDDEAIRRSHPFLVKDVAVSSLLLASNEALLELARQIEADEAERAEITGWVAAGRRGLSASWSEKQRLCLGRDLRAQQALPARTAAGLAPLFAASIAAELRRGLLEELQSVSFAGQPDLRWPLPPSTSPLDRAFERRNYWRGPVWPVVNWLFWLGLSEAGESEHAESLRVASLEQLVAGGMAEYFEPFSGEPLGAVAQSWTAAAALDWLAEPSQGAAG